MKSKKIILLLTVLIMAIVLLTGCTGTINNDEPQDLSNLNTVTNAVANKEGYSKYTNDEGISFYCPSDWISVGEEGTLFFVAPDSTGTSANLLSEEIGSMISLSGYVEIAKAKLPEAMDITSEIKQEQINLNGREAYVISYSAQESGIEMSVLQEVIKVDSKVYILTVGTKASNYTQAEETLNNILSSLTK